MRKVVTNKKGEEIVPKKKMIFAVCGDGCVIFFKILRTTTREHTFKHNSPIFKISFSTCKMNELTQ